MTQRETTRFDPDARPERSESLRRVASSAWGVVLIVVLVLGFLTVSTGPTLRSPPRASLVDGSWTTALEDDLMDGTLLRSVATTTWGVLDLVVFRQGLPGVLVGRDGWLFTTEEFARSAVAERFTTAAPLQEIRSAAERLEADGVDLVVVLVPSKARVQEEQLGRYTLPAAAERRYDVLLEALRGSGVATVDGAAAMARAPADVEPFLRTDTHWTPAGAQAVAARTAERLRARHDGAAWLDATSYALRSEGSLRVEGDLLSFVPLGPFAGTIGPEADRIPNVRAVRTGGGGGGILGPVELPVTLVGTSYSADDRWGFADALRAGLGSDVLVAATEGDGPFDPMQSYLNGEAYANARPDVVVWEIPERYAWPEVGP